MNKTYSYFVQRFFTSYLIGQHNYGKNTVSSYRDTFKLLTKYLSEHSRTKKNIPIASITKKSVLGFMDWLETVRGNSSSTRNVRLAHVKSFYHYVMVEAPEYANLCESILNIPFLKVEKRPPEYIPEDVLDVILHSIDSSKPNGIRHLAMLSLLYDSGCRVQELIDLKVKDIQFEKGQRIYVHGKGDKYREIPLMKATENILKKYLELHPRSFNDTLFTNRKGDPLTRQGIRYILKKYVNAVGEINTCCFDGNVYPHILRHSRATHLVNAGINIYNVRDFLGHVSVETTQVYLTSNPEVTRKAIEKAAAQTVPDSIEYFSKDEKQSLLDFLETLI